MHSKLFPRWRLTLKTAQGLRVAGDFIGQEFQRYATMQASVVRFVHNSHPAATQLLHNSVVRDSLADHPGDAWLSGRFILKMRPAAVNE